MPLSFAPGCGVNPGCGGGWHRDLLRRCDREPDPFPSLGDQASAACAHAHAWA